MDASNDINQHELTPSKAFNDIFLSNQSDKNIEILFNKRREAMIGKEQWIEVEIPNKKNVEMAENLPSLHKMTREGNVEGVKTRLEYLGPDEINSLDENKVSLYMKYP